MQKLYFEGAKIKNVTCIDKKKCVQKLTWVSKDGSEASKCCTFGYDIWKIV